MLMRCIRRLYRIPAVLFWLILNMFESIPKRYQRNHEKSVREMAQQVQYWGKGFLKIFGINLVIHGDMEEYRKNGGLMVSNHLGYFDIFVHGSLFGVRFTPKREIRWWPFFGWYVGLTRPIWVWRNNSISHTQDMIKGIRETLDMKVPVIVYPEGSSTDGFSGLKPFKGAPFEPVQGTRYKILPILTFWTYQNGDVNPAWYGDMTLLPHLWKVLGNKTVTADVFLLPMVSAEGRNRKQLAAYLHETMSAEYERCSAMLRERKQY